MTLPICKNCKSNFSSCECGNWEAEYEDVKVIDEIKITEVSVLNDGTHGICFDYKSRNNDYRNSPSTERIREQRESTSEDDNKS